MAFTAYFVLQVPWVHCVADCHDSIHPDLGPTTCRSVGCEHDRGSGSHVMDESSQSEIEHTLVLLDTVRPKPFGALPELSASPGFTVTPDGCEPIESAPCTRRPPAPPETPLLVSVVLLL